MSLAAEVQVLHDAVAAQSAALAELISHVTDADSNAAKLTAQLAVVQSGAAIDAEDLAEIVASTAAITASIANIKSVLPAPISAAVVAAAAEVSSPVEPPAAPAV